MTCQDPNQHYTVKIVPDVIEICKDLFETTDVTYFLHTRVYNDGSIYTLTSHPEIYKNHFEKQYPILPAIPKSIIKEKFYYLTVPSEIESSRYDQALHDFRNDFNVDWPLIIFEIKDNYFEISFFLTTPDNSSIINFYINQIESLEKFILFLRKNLTNFFSKVKRTRYYFLRKCLWLQEIYLRATQIRPTDQEPNIMI